VVFIVVLLVSDYSVPATPAGARDYPFMDDHATNSALSFSALLSGMLFIGAITLRYRRVWPGAVLVLLAFILWVALFWAGFVFATPVTGPGGSTYYLQNFPGSVYFLVWAAGGGIVLPFTYIGSRKAPAG
jgi:hypothetical protein